MSEREIRSLLRRFLADFDRGRLRTAVHRLDLKKWITPPLVGASLGLGVAACSDDDGEVKRDSGTEVVDRGFYGDYGVPFDMPQDQEQDQEVVDRGFYGDYGVPFDMPQDQEQDQEVVDRGFYGDYTAPFDDPPDDE